MFLLPGEALLVAWEEDWNCCHLDLVVVEVAVGMLVAEAGFAVAEAVVVIVEVVVAVSAGDDVAADQIVQRKGQQVPCHTQTEVAQVQEAGGHPL